VVPRVVEPVPVVVVAEPPAVIEGELGEVEAEALGVAVVVVLPVAVDPSVPLFVLLAPVPIVLAVVPVPAVVAPGLPAATVPAGHGEEATVVEGVEEVPVVPMLPVVLPAVPLLPIDPLVPVLLVPEVVFCVPAFTDAGAEVVDVVLAGAPVVVVVEPPTVVCAPTAVGVPTLV
jgi:hypothetical protein